MATLAVLYLALFQDLSKDELAKLKEMVRDSRYVFVGTGQSEKDGSVRIALGAVLQHPENTDSELSDLMDVQVADLKLGKTYIFFGGERTSKDPIRKLGRCSARVHEPKLEEIVSQLITDVKVERLIVEADRIVVGKVESIRVRDQAREPMSEHDPVWTEATIAIETTLKGKAAEKTVTITFAASRDVMWWQSPKFEKGQEGIWIIGKNELTDSLRFHSKDKLEWVRRLLPKPKK